MKRNILIGSLVAVVAVTGATPVFALHDLGDRSDRDRQSESKVEDITSEVVESVDDNATKNATRIELAVSRSERIEQRKAELRQRLEANETARKSRLEGRRLARCQNRQANINALIDRSAENGKRHLTNIQRVEDSVKAFAEKKALDKASYQEALEDVDTKEAEAAGTLEVLAAQDFDCAEADGEKPSGVIRITNEARRTALSDYRDSVINLIHTIKQAYPASVTENSSTSDTEVAE